MQTIKAEYAGKCCQCGLKHDAGFNVCYDASAPRGQKVYCLDCGFSRKAAAKVEPVKETVKPSPAFDTDEAQKKLREDHIEAKAPVLDLAGLIAQAVAPLVQGRLDEARVIELVREHTKPQAHTITVNDAVTGESRDMGRQHKQFATLLKVCQARTHSGRLNVWVTGAAGTGKTSAAEGVAVALGMPFAVMPTQTDAYGFYGYNSPGTGEYQRTPARDIWEKGGVLILDDFDGTPADVAIQLNAPFANGHSTFPDGVVRRHVNCILIVTANTCGHGATMDYVGTTKQNAAFLDRFVFLDWTIDEELERDTCPNPKWAERVQAVRGKVKAKGIKVLVTPRASYYGAALLEAGIPWAEVEAMTLRKAMNTDQWESVR